MKQDMVEILETILDRIGLDKEDTEFITGFGRDLILYAIHRQTLGEDFSDGAVVGGTSKGEKWMFATGKPVGLLEIFIDEMSSKQKLQPHKYN